MSTVATEFPPKYLGINDFLFKCIVVPMPQHGNEISTSLCRNFIPTSLSGNEIPTKWHGNEIPTNCPWELYTIYNPAPRKVEEKFQAEIVNEFTGEAVEHSAHFHSKEDDNIHCVQFSRQEPGIDEGGDDWGEDADVEPGEEPEDDN